MTIEMLIAVLVLLPTCVFLGLLIASAVEWLM